MSAYRLLVGILICACLLLLGVSALIFLRFQIGLDLPYLKIVGPSQLQYWGQLGDFFGGMLNPLLSFTALLAVLYNIKLQSEELALTRYEAKNNNVIQRQQARTFERQLFDTTFFGLLNAHKDILKDVRFAVGGKSYSGRSAFDYISQDLSARLSDGRRKSVVADVEGIIRVCDIFHDQYQSIFGHYFRNLYHILKLIDSTEAIQTDGEIRGASLLPRSNEEGAAKRRFWLDYSRRRQYSNFLRAQLSNSEVQILFVNCLTESGKGLKPLVEMYSMLKTLRSQQIFGGHTDVLNLFDPLAYTDYEDIDQNHLWSFAKNFRVTKIRSRLKRPQRAV